MLGAARVQIPKNNLDDLHSSIEEDGTSKTMDPQDLLGSLLLADIDLIILGCDSLALVDSFTPVEDNIGLLKTRFDEEAIFVVVFPEDVTGSVNLTLLSLFFEVTVTNLALELLMLGQPVSFDGRHFRLRKKVLCGYEKKIREDGMCSGYIRWRSEKKIVFISFKYHNFSPITSLSERQTRPPEELNAEIADTIIESIPSLPIPVWDGDSQQEEIDIVTETDDVLPPSVENDNDYDPLLEEVDLFLSDNSIPPGIENVADDPEGDIRFMEELLINDSILSHESFDSNFEENRQFHELLQNRLMLKLMQEKRF
uniref:Reverse transcriptase domain-containing protein n=1 Tax=Tanacetum cinerariifolium TaxID=118510 RepID=A0A6L2N4U3_TANCI|nr:hypothetical protein [Tanacetum cinerariifolium]